MLRAVAHRGPDGLRTRVTGPVAMGHAELRTTPDSDGDCQPLADRTGQLWIALDGRLDNRDEICLALRDPAARTASDAALVLRAYDRWGESAVGRLVGDFAFALWDARRGRLLCARDALGIRPLYYRVDDHAFRWASELRALVVDPRFRALPNEGFLGEFLSAQPVDCEETVLRDVWRLPSAHLLLVDRERLRKIRYWDPEPPVLRGVSDEEYGDRLGTVLKTALHSRLRSRTALGAQLSGGLDSSSIVALAASRRSGPEQPGGLEALSLVFPGRPYDERRFIEDVVVHCAVRAHLVPGPLLDEGALLAPLRRSFDLPDSPTGEPLLRPLLDVAVARGFRVILTGAGGDEWLQGSDFYVADLIHARRWRTLLRLLHATPADSPFDRSLGVVLQAGVRPLLPATARRTARRLLRRTLVPPWVAPAFAARIGLEDRLRRRSPVLPRGGCAQADIKGQLESGWEALMKEHLDRSAAAFGVEYRHPFYDRRLVEFALSLPEEQRQSPEFGKVALRRAMRGYLPDSVRLRASKVHYAALYLQAIDALGGERLFGRLAIAERGWVDGDRVQRMYRDAVMTARAGDDRYAASMIPLWSICSVEHWLRLHLGDNGGRS